MEVNGHRSQNNGLEHAEAIHVIIQYYIIEYLIFPAPTTLLLDIQEHHSCMLRPFYMSCMV
jgi:hypothetical protein